MKRLALILMPLVLVIPQWILGSAQNSDWPLRETLYIPSAFFNFRMDYPAGWLADRQQGIAVINELESDHLRAFESAFATQGYSIRFEFPQLGDLREQGLPTRDATVEDLLLVSSQRYAYQEPAEVLEVRFHSWPALRVRTVDSLDNEIVSIQGFLGAQPFLLSLAAPSAEALDAFLPTWDDMLSSLEMVKGAVNVGAYPLAFECSGDGSPTVILEVGWGGTYSDWAFTMRQVDEFTHVCAANRRTELGPGAVQQHTTDLHTLLMNAHIEGPYVLVGHSYGGLVIRVYADEYPDDAVGMVLVDSSHEDQLSRDAEILSPEAFEEEMAYFGDFAASLERVAATGSLGDIALVVLTAPIAESPPSFISQEVNEQIQKIWVEELQPTLAALSTNSTHIIVEGTTHNSLVVNRAVVDAIRQVVEDVRRQADS
jgi:hypothetical protein